MLTHNVGITSIGVSGFKSISDEQNIEIRPLTLLAGANSSGKSSIMQPLLLLKQTLEASYDPGPLMITGPNVKFSSFKQIFSKSKNKIKNVFCINIELGNKNPLSIFFKKGIKKPLELIKIRFHNDIGRIIDIDERMSSDEIKNTISSVKAYRLRNLDFDLSIVRNRCFLSIKINPPQTESDKSPDSSKIQGEITLLPFPDIYNKIQEIIHLPGLRGNPDRTYNISGVEKYFPGTFEQYTASIISKWQGSNELDKIENLCNNLKKIGLTSYVKAKNINDTQVEIQVGRLPAWNVQENGNDYVDIADVGFGVSQTLPILVALAVAKKGQLVYIEQPETHLHPRAQTAMAEILAEAAMSGIIVVVETHSSLILQGIQTLVAEDKISPDLVKLHWFTRNEDGSTKVHSADLNGKGAFGEWPEDFGEVSLYSESRYLDAVEKKRWTER